MQKHKIQIEEEADRHLERAKWRAQNGGIAEGTILPREFGKKRKLDESCKKDGGVNVHVSERTVGHDEPRDMDWSACLQPTRREPTPHELELEEMIE